MIGDCGDGIITSDEDRLAEPRGRLVARSGPGCGPVSSDGESRSAMMETAMTRMAAQTAQWTMAFIAEGSLPNAACTTALMVSLLLTRTALDVLLDTLQHAVCP